MCRRIRCTPCEILGLVHRAAPVRGSRAAPRPNRPAAARRRRHGAEPVTGDRTLEAWPAPPTSRPGPAHPGRRPDRRPRPDRWPAVRRRSRTARAAGVVIEAQRRGGRRRYSADAILGGCSRLAEDRSAAPTAPVSSPTKTVYRNNWMRVREDTYRRPTGRSAPTAVVDKTDFAVVIAEEDGALPSGRAVPIPARPAVVGVPDGHLAGRAVRHRRRARPPGAARGDRGDRCDLATLAAACTRPAASARRVSPCSTPPS